MDNLTAVATPYGLDLLKSTLRDKATKYAFIGASTHDSDNPGTFHTGTIETSYFDDNGVLTFVIEMPTEEDFGKYLYSVAITDDANKIVVETPTPKIALAKGIGGMMTIKAAVTGEPGEVIFKASDYVTESELQDKWLVPATDSKQGQVRLATDQEVRERANVPAVVQPHQLPNSGLESEPLYLAAEYPFADNVKDGDLVYLYHNYGSGTEAMPVEYRPAKDRPNGYDYRSNINGSSLVDYTKHTSSFVGFADTANNKIWLSGMPSEVKPTGLAADKDWWLSANAAGGLQSTQPYANRDPVGFTDESGEFHTYKGMQINQQLNYAANFYLIEAVDGEDISIRVRAALRKYAAVSVTIPTGVTCTVSDSRIDVINRILRITVQGRLDCNHRAKHTPYSGSGDWYEVSSFLIGSNGSLYIDGSGEVYHQVGDVGAANLAPYYAGLISGFAYNSVYSAANGKLAAVSYNLKFYLSTCLFNHLGGGSHYDVQLLGPDFYREATYLNAAPTAIAAGSWSFKVGTLTLETTSNSWHNGVTRGTSGNTDGYFTFADIVTRNPGYTY